MPDSRDILVLHYRLNADDRASVAEFYGDQPLPQWFTVTKKASGGLETVPDRRPKRDRHARTTARAALLDDTARVRLTHVSEADSPEDRVEAVTDETELNATIESLDDEPGTLTEADLERLEAFAVKVREADELVLADLLDAAVQAERQPHPAPAARKRLWARTPDFVWFSQAERELAPEYDLEVVAAEPPVALANLARLARLDLGELLATIHANETGTVEFLERTANARLAVIFAAWSQEPKDRGHDQCQRNAAARARDHRYRYTDAS